MDWKRLEPGCYVSGRYKVTKGITNWYAHGPGGPTVGVPHVHRTKALAQQACAEAFAWRQHHGLGS
jgi:hypothetical protein